MAWMKNSNYIIKIGILPEMLAISSHHGQAKAPGGTVREVLAGN